MDNKKILLGVVEDFVPLNDTDALVTSGKYFSSLTAIYKVQYKLSDGSVELICDDLRLLAQGYHLRLGGMFDRSGMGDYVLVYSDSSIGIIEQAGNLVNLIGPEDGIQPWIHAGSLYYNKKLDSGFPTVWKDENVFIQPWNGYYSMGKPMVDGDWLYFEARKTKAPLGWQVWRKSLTTGKQECILERGANPNAFSGKLFYGIFYSRIKRYDIKYVRLPNEKS